MGIGLRLYISTIPTPAVIPAQAGTQLAPCTSRRLDKPRSPTEGAELSPHPRSVIPAKAGTHGSESGHESGAWTSIHGDGSAPAMPVVPTEHWIPAFAGMTVVGPGEEVEFAFVRQPAPLNGGLHAGRTLPLVGPDGTDRLS